MESLSADPQMITAKEFRKCSETGKTIRPGEECIYQPSTKKVFHMESAMAYDFNLWILALTTEIN